MASCRRPQHTTRLSGVVVLLKPQRRRSACCCGLLVGTSSWRSSKRRGGLCWSAGGPGQGCSKARATAPLLRRPAASSCCIPPPALLRSAGALLVPPLVWQCSSAALLAPSALDAESAGAQRLLLSEPRQQARQRSTPRVRGRLPPRILENHFSVFQAAASLEAKKVSATWEQVVPEFTTHAAKIGGASTSCMPHTPTPLGIRRHAHPLRLCRNETVTLEGGGEAW